MTAVSIPRIIEKLVPFFKSTDSTAIRTFIDEYMAAHTDEPHTFGLTLLHALAGAILELMCVVESDSVALAQLFLECHCLNEVFLSADRQKLADLIEPIYSRRPPLANSVLDGLPAINMFQLFVGTLIQMI
jgi:hypothetical protein